MRSTPSRSLLALSRRLVSRLSLPHPSNQGKAKPQLIRSPAPSVAGGIASFFSAHPKSDPATKLIYNQGVALGPSAKLNMMKVRR